MIIAMKKNRYHPTRNFPSYIFVPGENPHPKKEGGHMEGEDDPLAAPLDHDHPEQNEFLRYSLDLYNHGYYWESHVYFEALWNAHQREGSAADFLKGMIKLGAAGVKLNIKQPGSAKGHFERAKELFVLIKEKEGRVFLGFDLEKLIDQTEMAVQNNGPCFEVHPLWE